MNTEETIYIIIEQEVWNNGDGHVDWDTQVIWVRGITALRETWPKHPQGTAMRLDDNGRGTTVFAADIRVEYRRAG